MAEMTFPAPPGVIVHADGNQVVRDGQGTVFCKTRSHSSAQIPGDVVWRMVGDRPEIVLAPRNEAWGNGVMGLITLNGKQELWLVGTQGSSTAKDTTRVYVHRVPHFVPLAAGTTAITVAIDEGARDAAKAAVISAQAANTTASSARATANDALERVNRMASQLAALTNTVSGLNSRLSAVEAHAARLQSTVNQLLGRPAPSDQHIKAIAHAAINDQWRAWRMYSGPGGDPRLLEMIYHRWVIHAKRHGMVQEPNALPIPVFDTTVPDE